MHFWARCSYTEREEIRFESGGDRCAAWLYPGGSPGPAIVMAHGLTGTRRDRLGAFAERFAREGISALVFDHRGFGDSGGEPDLFEPGRQHEDWGPRRRRRLAARRAPLGELRTYPGVDHFYVYDGPEHEAVVADEIEFLRRHLRPG